jgi:DNA-binding NarL/FixJ family response regulator
LQAEFMSTFVIDEHPLMREAMGALIRRLNHAAHVIEFSRPGDALQAVKTHGTPDLICLELQSQDTRGLSDLQDLKERSPDTPIVVLTAGSGQDLEQLSIDAGASAFIHKSASSAEIANVLRVFVGGDPEPVPEAPPEKLSKRQKQLLNLLDKGMSNRDIAESLQISEHTVKVHLWRLFRRLNVKSRSQASHLARTQGLL